MTKRLAYCDEKTNKRGDWFVTKLQTIFHVEVDAEDVAEEATEQAGKSIGNELIDHLFRMMLTSNYEKW